MEIDTVLVKVASRCNINCSYCYVYNMGDDGWRDMPSLISVDTISALCLALQNLSTDQVRPFAIVLHGGEPLMLGSRRLAYLLRSLRDATAAHQQISIQTNGVLLTASVLDICATHRVSISVSVDGPAEINDKFRIGKRGEGTYDKVAQGVRLLREHQQSDFLFAGLLSVVNPMSDARAVYDHLKRMGAHSIDFLYRDGNHAKLPFGKSSFESTEYAEWFCELLDVYLADPAPPKVRFLDDLIKLSMGGSGVKEGLGQTEYGIAIIETNGLIAKNDTLKSSFDGADKFNSQWSVHSHRLSEVFNTAEFASYHSLQKPSSDLCLSCKHLAVCGGGMPLHRWKPETGYKNPSVYCEDQKMLINRIRERLVAAGVVA